MQILSKSVYGFIWHFIKQQKLGFVLIQLFALAWSLDATLWPYIMRLAIEVMEKYTGPRDEIWSAISGIIISGLVLWLLIEIGNRLGGIYRMLVVPKYKANIRMFMYDYVNNHSHSYFMNNFAGSMANKISDMPRSSWAILDMITVTFIPVLAAIIISIVFFSLISPLFAFILTMWIITHISICCYYAKNCSYFSEIHSESNNKLLGRIVDSLSNNMNVRLFSRQSFEYKHTLRYQKEEINKQTTSLWYVEKMRIILGIVGFVAVGIIMTTYEIYCYKNSIIDLSEFIYIFNTSFQISMMVWFAGMQIPDAFAEYGICKQALTLVTTPIEIKDQLNASELKVNKGKIEFKNVTFNYEFNKNIFKNKSLIINGGEKIGLVGASGSGKTTFVNLILRCYDISNGQILIDDQDIKAVTQMSLRKQISMISQEPLLFHRTLMENIRYGNLNATDDEVIEAAKLANCHEFIINLEDEYNTIAGERGLKLSGGQKQRIAIARTILKNSPIIILDEATSALDSVTEKYIQESMQNIMLNRTALIIAHRLSTLADMDRILVFKKGDIIEDGSHEELLNLRGEYYKLWNMQSNGFLPETSDDEEIADYDIEE